MKRVRKCQEIIIIVHYLLWSSLTKPDTFSIICLEFPYTKLATISNKQLHMKWHICFCYTFVPAPQLSCSTYEKFYYKFLRVCMYKHLRKPGQWFLRCLQNAVLRGYQILQRCQFTTYLIQNWYLSSNPKASYSCLCKMKYS